MNKLKGKKIAILTENGFEESELTEPRQALMDEGADVEIISAHKGKVKAWNHDHWGVELDVQRTLDAADPRDYDAVLIPGGVMNPDSMRKNKKYVDFARNFMENGKPVASICHGPQLLIETGLLKGRNLTSYDSIKTDLENAGAKWVDKEVVVDNTLITSRSPKDLSAFNKKIIEFLGDRKN